MPKSEPLFNYQQTQSSARLSQNVEIFRFQQALRQFLPTPIDLTLNENTSNFVSIRFNIAMKPIGASIHKMFVNAPKPILEALAAYIQTKGQDAFVTQTLRSYISSNAHEASCRLQRQPQGKFYNLTDIAHELNKNLIGLSEIPSCTWFSAAKRRRPKTQCSLGLYCDELKLIKINSLLDSQKVPKEVIGLVVYHEMLHALYPPRILPSGRRIVHTPEFRKAEERYPNLLDAEQWLDDNRDLFFNTDTQN